MRCSTKEADVLRACLDYLTARGIFHWRNAAAGIRRRDRRGREFWAKSAAVGTPDIIFVLPGGRAGFAECKRPGGKLSEGQAAFLERAGQLGALAVCVYSLDDLRRALGDIP